MRRYKLAVTFVVALSCISIPAPAQDTQQNSSPGANVRNRAQRAPGLWVRAGIDRHINGPEITQVEPPDPQFQQILLVEFLQNFFAQLNALINFLPGLIGSGDGDGGGGGSVGGVNDIVMTEIAHDGTVAFVELLNNGPIEIRLNGWHFSDGSAVSPSLPQIELDRNDTIVVQLGGETQRDFADVLLGFRLQSVAAGELALYDFSNVTGGLLPIEDPDLMIDYVQWIDFNEDRDPPLEPVASAANLWTTIDSIPSTLSGQSFRLAAEAEGRQGSNSRDFIIVPFDPNTLGVPESQLSSAAP